MACDFEVRFTRRVSVMVFTALLLLPTPGIRPVSLGARREQS